MRCIHDSIDLVDGDRMCELCGKRMPEQTSWKDCLNISEGKQKTITLSDRLRQLEADMLDMRAVYEAEVCYRARLRIEELEAQVKKLEKRVSDLSWDDRQGGA